MKHIFMRSIRSLLDFFLPYRCLGCGKTGTPLCSRCARAISSSDKHESPWIFSRFSYKDALCKKIIHHLKKYPNMPLHMILARYGAELILEELSELAVFESISQVILIPIPLHKKRLGERGFHQSSLHAKALYTVLQNSVPQLALMDVLLKIKKTPKQALITEKTLRLATPRGSISVNTYYASSIRDAHCILIDDVSTTGATLAECKRVLLQHGAKRVIAYTIAH